MSQKKSPAKIKAPDITESRQFFMRLFDYAATVYFALTVVVLPLFMWREKYTAITAAKSKFFSTTSVIMLVTSIALIACMLMYATAEDALSGKRKKVPFRQKIKDDPMILAEAWAGLMGKGASKRAPDAEKFEPIVTAPVVSVSSRVVHVLRGLVSGRLSRLRQLFTKGENRSTTVATFLAVLDLVRHGRLKIDEDEQLTVSRGRLNGPDGERSSEWT